METNKQFIINADLVEAMITYIGESVNSKYTVNAVISLISAFKQLPEYVETPNIDESVTK